MSPRSIAVFSIARVDRGEACVGNAVDGIDAAKVVL